MAEQFSAAKVPVVLEDPEGKLLARFAEGGGERKLPAEPESRRESTASFEASFPAAVWSAFSGDGIPFRVRVSDLGPDLLSGMLQLTPPQAALLADAFAAADREGLLLDDAADLSAYLARYPEKKEGAGKPNAGVAARTGEKLDALLRACGRDPFGTPQVSLWDFLLSGKDKRGVLHFVEGKESGYCLLWLLAAMAQTLPEREKGEKPVLAFVLSERTAKTAAGTMQKALQERGILLAAQGDPGEVSSAFSLKVLEGVEGDPAPQEGGLSGILERTLRLPFAAGLRKKEELNSAKEILLLQEEREEAKKTGRKEKGEENKEKEERKTQRGSGAWHEVGRSVAGTVGRQIGEDVGRNFGDFGRRLGGNLGASLGRGILSTLLRH